MILKPILKFKHKSKDEFSIHRVFYTFTFRGKVVSDYMEITEIEHFGDLIKEIRRIVPREGLRIASIK